MAGPKPSLNVFVEPSPPRVVKTAVVIAIPKAPPNGPDQPKVAGEADLGYRLASRYWRRGYATEGARELIRYGFADVGLTRIFAQTMAVNTASRATMNAAGLAFVRAFICGEPYDDPIPGAEQGEVEYEITRTRWQRLQNLIGSALSDAETT